MPILKKVPTSGPYGSVTNVSASSTNGFVFNITDPTTTPNITLSTSVAAGAIIKSDGTAIVAATPDNDYLTPETAASTYLAKAGGTMAGNLILNADAALPLQAVTYQQLNSAAMGIYKLQGGYNPTTTSLYPVAADTTNPVSAIVKQGMIWVVTVDGIVNGQIVKTGYQLLALIDSPAQLDANWLITPSDLGYVPLSEDLISAKIYLGNASNKAVAVDLGGDLTVNNTGIVTIANQVINNAKLENMPNNTVKGNKSGVSSAPSNLTLSDLAESTSNILTITNGSKSIISSSNLTIQVKQSTNSQDGYLSSTDWNAFNNKQTATLPNGNILVGNISDIATPVAVSGDATINNTGSLILNTVNSDVGTFGDGTHVPQITVNAKGLITSINPVLITGASPTGGAGGDLTGNYPNPTVANLAITNAKIANATIDLTTKVTGILPNSNTTAEAYNSGGNIPNSIVSRDAFGILQANSATIASQIAVIPDSTDTISYPLFVNNLGPASQIAHTNSSFNYDAVTNTLTCNLNGNAATVTTNANLSGAVTSVGNATSITNSAVTYVKIQDVNATRLLGNPTGSSAAPSEISLGSGLSFAGTTLVSTGSGGTVTNFSINNANGFNGSVLNPTTTPTLTIQTTVNGILKGNGTVVSAAVAADIPIINNLSSTTNTMTSNVNGNSSNAAIINSNSISSATNTITSSVNGVSSNTSIVNSNALSLSTTSLTSSVNGITSSNVQVCPSPQSISSSITLNNLDERIILIAPSVNAVGTYSLQLKNSSQELNIIFTVSGNSSTNYNYSTINILQITDTTGTITVSNISNYVLFRGYVRTTATNTYFAVTFSMPNQLLYTNPVTLTIWQYGASYLNENTAITAMITADISNLVSLAAADLIFKMNVNVVPISASNPQGYLYFPGSSNNAIFQYRINQATGALTALSPASVAMTAPYKIAATTLRNYIYVTNTTLGIFMFRVGSNGTLSALSPASIVGPSTPTGIAIDPTDRFVYVCGFGTGQFGQFSITKSTGQLVAIPSPPTAAAQMAELAIHPSGKYLYAINSGNGLVYQYAINQTTGALTALGTPTIAAGATPVKIQIHPSGLFAYVLNNGASTISVFAINTTTGQLTLASTFTSGSIGNMLGLRISNNGLFIYYTSQTSNTINQSTLNLSTGAIIAPTTSQTVPGARECCFDFSGNYLYVVNNLANNINVFSINKATGAMTSIGTVAAGANANSLIAI